MNNGKQTKKIFRAFFVKNLVTILIPMLVPLLVLGTLSTFFIQQYVKDEINNSNMNLLKQTKENMELIFNELDSLHLHIVASAIEFVNLNSMLDKHMLDLDDYKELAKLKNFIDSPAIARPYIDSIYIYLNNDHNRFITSSLGGLVELNEFYDRDWLESFQYRQEKETFWTETRKVMKITDENRPTKTELISMYRKLSVTRDGDGVIVLNINPQYIEEHLASLSTLDGQGLLIVDKNNEVIFKNHTLGDLNPSDLAQIIRTPTSFFSMEVNQEPFIISKLSSEKYGWTFVSIVPNSSLYEVPIRLSMTALLLLFLSFLGGTAIAYYFTQQKYNDIKSIVTILESAENGRPLLLPSRKKDVYSYIIQSILKNFVEQNYLKVQLSERKYKAQAMEYTALQSQLNPHFLYNTLETIYWKAASLTGRPNELNEIVENLADILRFTLDSNDKLVILKKEIFYTLSYVKIQSVRYKDKFDVIWEYDDDVQKYNVMKLILQPLIENSLYHGLKERPGRGLIKIKIRVVHSVLRISVIDNGIGILPEKLQEIRTSLDSASEQTNHIGLFNTHKRLKLTYGDQYGVTIRSKFGWGTCVQLSFPID